MVTRATYRTRFKRPQIATYVFEARFKEQKELNKVIKDIAPNLITHLAAESHVDVQLITR